MTDHDDADRRLHHGLREHLGLWGFSTAARLSLLNLSENTVYLAEEEARRVVLRVHRWGYHTPPEIASELAWIGAVRAARVVETPAPLCALDGGLLHALRLGESERMVVAFDWVPGRSPDPRDDLTRWFAELGAITARLHAHARSWTPPPGFGRKRWTVETTLGPRGHWGDWRRAVGLDASAAALLARAAATIAADLARYGADADRFGLIHGDLRLTNLLVDDSAVDGDRLRVIDFDDCGFGWFMYDVAASVSFFEDDPRVPALLEAWSQGYRCVAPLAPEDVAIMPALVLLRRILLLAWVASHPNAPTAQAMGDGYTVGALALADRFLSAR
ncbi:MAG: phosphotransferase [Proteobacteria bacterium]|nr:phosphotransferase [Pseudomonadota bacterium]